MHSSQTVSGFRGFQSRRRGLRKRSGEKEAADEVDRSCAGVKRDSRSAVCLSRGSRLTLGGGGPLLIVPPQHSCASPCLRTAPETAAGLIGLDRHPAAGCRPGWSFRLPDATSCASTNRCSVWSVTTRLRVLRTVRASPARSCSPRGGSARQAFPGASPEVSVPFSASGRVALSGVAVLQTIPLRRLSPLPQPDRLDIGRCRWASPLRSYADVHGGIQSRVANAGPARVMHRRCLWSRCSATQPDELAAWPGGLSRQRSWGSSPSQCCSCPTGDETFRSRAPTCRFSKRPPR